MVYKVDELDDPSQGESLLVQVIRALDQGESADNGAEGSTVQRARTRRFAA